MCRFSCFVFPRMLKAIYRDSRFGQQMVDLNTSLNTYYYLLWNVSNFIQTKRKDCGPIRDIIETALTQRTTNALWMLLLLQLASILGLVVGNGEDQTLLCSWYGLGICVWQFYFVFRCPLKLASIWGPLRLRSNITKKWQQIFEAYNSSLARNTARNNPGVSEIFFNRKISSSCGICFYRVSGIFVGILIMAIT